MAVGSLGSETMTSRSTRENVINKKKKEQERVRRFVESGNSKYWNENSRLPLVKIKKAAENVR